MLVGIAAATEEMSINPLQFLFGKSVTGGVFGGMNQSVHKVFSRSF